MAKQWSDMNAVSQSLTANATVIASGGNVANISLTFIRMIGEYIICPTSAPVAGDNVNVTLGICIVSNDAFISGAGAMPDPADEPEFPWLYLMTHPLFFPDTSLVSGAANASVRHSFDIRSKRKVKAQQTLATIAQYVNIAGNPPLTLSFANCRVLHAEG